MCYIHSISLIYIYIYTHNYTYCTLTMFDRIAKSCRWTCAIWIHVDELLGNHQLSSSRLERTWWRRCHKPGMAMAAMAHAVYCKWDRLASQDGSLGHQPSTINIIPNMLITWGISEVWTRNNQKIPTFPGGLIDPTWIPWPRWRPHGDMVQQPVASHGGQGTHFK